MAKKKTRDDDGAKTHAFGAEVSRLLEILIHSVYADRDVFLRELVSNAADACDKLRYLGVTEPALLGSDGELAIRIISDREAGVLTITDNGVGMSREELVDDLGTIAKSGTRAFMEGQAEGAAATSLIGQFGIGFYSAFIVAGEVEVVSTKAGGTDAWLWRSDGTGTFAVEPAPDGHGVERGTRVVLKLRDGMEEFLDPQRLSAAVKTHSDHVAFPIDVIEITNGSPGDATRVNTASALWTRPRADVTAEQYTEFFGSISGQFDEPAFTIHYKAEGRHEYDVLLFVPSKRPFDLFDPSRQARVKLYVRRVLITEDAEILPSYLRFVRGVVDSADMPLTVSRDMLQDNSVAAAIRRAVTNRVLSTLAKQAEDKPEDFAKVWEAFGAVIKEGLYEDYERRDDLLDLVRFRSTAGEGMRSLKQYVADLKPNQTAIYYLTGEDAEQISTSPQLEGFRARGIEVLLLSDSVDGFWPQGVTGFDGKPLRSVTQGADDLKAIPLLEDQKDDEDAEIRTAEAATAVAFVKQTLGETVSEVRLSDRLVDSPACLVAADTGMDRMLERMLSERKGGARSAPVLELNPRHTVIAALARTIKNGSGAGAGAEDVARLLFDYALIADGETPSDLRGFGQRLEGLIEKALD